MRLTSLGIIIALMATFSASPSSAQIPERVLFQPGSYAGGAYQGTVAAPSPMTKTVLVPVSAEENEEGEIADSNLTDWEKNFGSKQQGVQMKEVQVPVQEEAGVVGSDGSAAKQAPYLAYHRCPLTGRTHIIPYQKGYPDPETFPKTQCGWKLWMSSHPSRTQNQPQIEYLDYYAPMPEIIADKPSRLQLLLGYPDPAWSSSCDNKWGHRLAQCKGIEMYACGPPAEWCVKNQCDDLTSARSHLGPLQNNGGAFRGNMLFGRRFGALRAAGPAAYGNAHHGNAWQSGPQSWCSGCKKTPCQTCKSCNSCSAKGCHTGCTTGCNTTGCSAGCNTGGMTGEVVSGSAGCAPPMNKFPKEISCED